MTKAEVEKRISAIFSSKVEFEKYILNVTCESDRVEVLEIVAYRLIRVLLKEELSFLYMKDLKSFKFSLIINIMFKELANEWVSYAQEFLGYSRESALEMMQEKSRVLFLLELTKGYFRTYKIYFLQEIADTFIELVENMPSPARSNALIDKVLRSDFTKSKNISVVYSYSQLWRHVKHAQSLKKKEITKLQIKIDQTKDVSKLKKYEYEEELLTYKSLAHFNEAVLRLRNTMVTYMMNLRETS